MAVWFTSDTHFGDRRALNIDRRPYPDLAAHDAGLIANWNERIAPDDTVWHLGDVALGPSDTRIAEIVGSLNGVKHLIIGNNDGPGTLALQAWASVGHYAEIDVDGRQLVLCHYAFRTWNGIGRGRTQPTRPFARQARAGPAPVRCRGRRSCLRPGATRRNSGFSQAQETCGTFAVSSPFVTQTGR